MDRIRRMLGCDSYDTSKYTGRGVYVAVLDSGVAPHPDLRGHIVEFRDFIGERRARVQQRGMYDDNGHGTHVRYLKNKIMIKQVNKNIKFPENKNS